jgi:transcriptional regulator with XRE-family HTH domain
MARPRIELDILRIEELAAQGLSQAEICLVIGISEDTLSRRKADSAAIADAIKSGRAKAASEISDTLYRMAKGGDLGAIVWYEKTRRGLTDKVQQEHSGGMTIKVVYADPTRSDGSSTETP